MIAGAVWLIFCFFLGGFLLLRKHTLAGFIAPPILAGAVFLFLGFYYHADYRGLLRLIPVYLPLALAIFAISDSFRNPPRSAPHGDSSKAYRGSLAGGHRLTGISRFISRGTWGGRGAFSSGWGFGAGASSGHDEEDEEQDGDD